MSKGETNTSFVGDYESVIYTSVQTVHLSAYNRLAAFKNKIELDSHTDTCVAGDHSPVVHDHNITVNVCDMIPKQDQGMLA